MSTAPPSVARARALVARYPALARVFGNSAWLLGDYVLRFGTALVLGVWFARTSGPGRFGANSFATSLVGLFAALSTLGLESVAVRDLVNEPEERAEILASAIVLRASGGIVTMALALLTAWVVRPGESETRWLVAIAGLVPLPQALHAIDLLFQARVRSRVTVVARNIAFGLASVVKACVLWAQLPVAAYAGVAVLEATLIGGAYLALYRSTEGHPLRLSHARWSRIRSWGRECGALVLTGLAISGYMRFDRVILAHFWPNEEQGMLNVAAQLVELLNVAPAAIATSVYPLLVASFRESEEAYTEQLVRQMSWAFWVGVALCAGYEIFAPAVVSLLFGPAYAGAAVVMRVLALNIPITFMSVLFSHRYVLRRQQTLSLLGTVFGVAVSVGLNVWLVPRWGAVGTAAASVLAYVVPTLTVTLVGDRSVGRIFIRAVLLQGRPSRAVPFPPGVSP